MHFKLNDDDTPKPLCEAIFVHFLPDYKPFQGG